MAGLILGLLGCAGMLLAVLVFGLAAIAGAAGFDVMSKHFKTAVRLNEAQQRIEVYRTEHQTLPDASAGRLLAAEYKDGWGKILLYERTGDTYLIRSAGPDGTYDTPDDLTTDNTGHGNRRSDDSIDFNE